MIQEMASDNLQLTQTRITHLRTLLKGFGGHLSKLDILVMLYLVLLGTFNKAFSYLHISLLGLPLYVGEVALFLALLSSYLKIRNGKAFLSPPWLLLVFGSWIFGCFFRFIWSWFEDGGFTAAARLRDFALVYQSLWVIWGYCLLKTNWKFLVILIPLGSLLASALYTADEVFQSLVGTRTMALGGVAGSEPIAQLMPWFFAFPLPRLGWFFASLATGSLMIGQILVYLKKTLIFGLIVIHIPLLVAGVKSIKPIRRYIFATILGIFAVLVLFSLGNVKQLGVKSGCEASQQFFTSSLSAESWNYRILHGEDVKALEEVRPIAQAPQMIGGEYAAWRGYLWEQTIDAWRTRPWFGFGFGPPVVRSVLYGDVITSEGRRISGPHNSYLALLFRMGVVGLVPLMVLLLAALTRLKDVYGNLVLAFQFSLTGAAAWYALFNVGLENPFNGNWFWIGLGGILGAFGVKQSKNMARSHSA